jgi:cyanophycinase-like exopeptidase
MGSTPVPLPRLIAIFGSGETSRALTSVHRDLISQLSVPYAILLDTPFGFEANADQIAARIITYFRDHVGCELNLASLRHSERISPVELEQFLSRLHDANYVFAGPGSPTYALRHWRDPSVRRRLVEMVTVGGCIAFSSAAAIGLGAYALPVYEIYKVGEDPSWRQGLDILGELGIRCAVVPHYNNREGGTYDTRFCYMGEARLRLLESMLPEDVVILGVDEHTACVIDAGAESVTVRGAGGITIRHRGVEQRSERSTFPLSQLQNSRTDMRAARARPVETVVAARLPTGSSRGDGREALTRGDVDGVVAAILQSESRSEIRHLVFGLARLARGQKASQQQLARLVDILLSLRRDARREQRFADADRLRSILAECGVEVQDTTSGTAWSLAHA